MSDNLPEFLRNSPGLQASLNLNRQLKDQQARMQEISQSVNEGVEDRWRQEEEDRDRDKEHLEASKAAATQLQEVTKALSTVSEALEQVHERLSEQSEESKEEARKSRHATWWSFSAGALAAVAAIGVPFIVLWLQSGG